MAVFTVGARLHDYGKGTPDELFGKVSADGFACVQLAYKKCVPGVASYADVTPQLVQNTLEAQKKHNIAVAVLGMNNVAELKTFVSNSLLFNQEANELYGQLYDAAEVNTDTLPEDVQQYFTNTVLYQPYLYAQMRGVSLETMLSQAGYSSVDEYLENSESSKQSMIKQILIMQALAEKNNIVCDTDILNAEFSRYFGSTDMTSYVNAYGENYVKTNILHDIVMQNQIDNVA